MIGSYIVPRDIFRYEAALFRLEQQAYRSKSDLPRLQAIDYVYLLNRNITQQKFLTQWPAYSRRYAEWKAEVGKINVGFWRLHDSLLGSLTVWELSVRGDKAWKGGIPAGVMDKGGTSWFGQGVQGQPKPKPIAMYARTIEFGEGPNVGKPRPLFVPTKEEYKDEGFVRRGEEELRRLADKWR